MTLVERLRQDAEVIEGGGRGKAELLYEAADEIERVQKSTLSPREDR